MKDKYELEAIADNLEKMEEDTLLGDYIPYGAHATVIYEYLREQGLVNIHGDKTMLGNQIVDIIRNRRKNQPFLIRFLRWIKGVR